MHIPSSFTHLHVVPNLYEFISAVEHKIRYFEECLGYNQLAIDLYCIYSNFIQFYWKKLNNRNHHKNYIGFHYTITNYQLLTIKAIEECFFSVVFLDIFL